MRQHHRGCAALFEVQIDAAGEEEAGDILMRRVAAAGPDVVDALALAFQFGADNGLCAVIGEPGRVADDDVDGFGAESNGADEVAGVVGPDVVAAFGVQAGERIGGAFEHRAVGVVGDADVVERLARVAALVELLGEACHEVIEPVALLDQRAGELEADVAFQPVVPVVFDFDSDGAAGEEAGSLGAELEGVAEVDRYGDIVGAAVAGGFEGFAGGEGPGGAGEVDGGGVYVDADDVGEQAAEDIRGLAARAFGGCEVLADCGENEGAGAAGGVEHALVERIGYDGVDDFAGEPVGRVILAEASAVVGGDDGFVEDAGDIGFRFRPVEAGDAAGEAAEPRAAFNLGRPGEEIGFDDAAHAGFVDEELPAEQLCRPALRVQDDIDTEGRLQRQRDNGGEIGVAEEKVVEVLFFLDHFAERGGEQLPPEAALDGDGRLVAVLVVEFAQRVEVLLEARTGAEPGAHLVVGRYDAAPLKRLRLVAQPFVEVIAVFGVVERKSVGACGAPVAAGPAQQPVFAVGEDAESGRASLERECGEVLLQLAFVGVGGVEAVADAAFDLDHEVVGFEVDAPAAGLALHLDVGAAREPRADQEVAHHAANVGFRRIVVVPLEQRLGGAAQPRIVGRDVRHVASPASSLDACCIEFRSQ